MRPENETADAEFEAILEKGDLNHCNVHRIRLEENSINEIKLENYCAIIAGGSPFDLSTPQIDKTPTQLAIEDFFQNLFAQIIPNDFPFLGACSGNGLLGKYCGVEISNKFAEPIGPVEINITPDGKNDELLKDFPNTFLALVGHKEACDTLPKGATLLATSNPCPIQMFRIKNNIYATQFHPEADEYQFSLRIDIYKNYGYFDPKKSNELKKKLHEVETPFSNEILKRFVQRYRED